MRYIDLTWSRALELIAVLVIVVGMVALAVRFMDWLLAAS
jgi:hypothetical protein